MGDLREVFREVSPWSVRSGGPDLNPPSPCQENKIKKINKSFSPNEPGNAGATAHVSEPHSPLPELTVGPQQPEQP